MTDNNGWPGKPGVPPNPDWTGAHHWLSYQGEEPGLYEWDGKYWKMGGGHAPMDYVVDHFTYIAPVLTPAEADARVAQARRDALEDCAKWHDEVASEYKKEQLLYEAKESWTVAYVFAQGYVINNKRSAAIRALGKEGND
jgi:hypothetical protein